MLRVKSMNENEKEFEAFFKDKSSVCLIDAIAKRYGLTPYKVVTEMTLEEFKFNLTVLAVAQMEENRPAKKNLATSDFGKMGISHQVIKKAKG